MSDLHTSHVNGIRMAYRTWGEPDAPPLVLLHGRGSDGADWLPVVPALAATHRVYAPDLRGHGASDRPGEYAFEAMRDDVVAFLDALGPEPVALAGHSMGAVVAYLVAAKRSSQLNALVLEEPVPPDPEVPPRAGALRPEGTRPATGGSSRPSTAGATPPTRAGGSCWRPSTAPPSSWPAERAATSRRTGSRPSPRACRGRGW